MPESPTPCHNKRPSGPSPRIAASYCCLLALQRGVPVEPCVSITIHGPGAESLSGHLRHMVEAFWSPAIRQNGTPAGDSSEAIWNQEAATLEQPHSLLVAHGRKLHDIGSSDDSCTTSVPPFGERNVTTWIETTEVLRVPVGTVLISNDFQAFALLSLRGFDRPAFGTVNSICHSTPAYLPRVGGKKICHRFVTESSTKWIDLER